MSKHTPGPWEVHNGTDVYPVGDYKARFYVADCDPDDAPLASKILEPGDHPRTDATYEQAKANARLIAAAPEMLEALKLAEGLLREPYETGVLGEDAYHAIASAISKAEGRS